MWSLRSVWQTGYRTKQLTSALTRFPPLAVVRASPTSTPGSVDFPTLPGFSFSRELWYFSGLQPGRLQRVGKAPFPRYQTAASVYFRIFPVFSCSKMSTLRFLAGHGLPIPMEKCSCNSHHMFVDIRIAI